MIEGLSAVHGLMAGGGAVIVGAIVGWFTAGLTYKTRR